MFDKEPPNPYERNFEDGDDFDYDEDDGRDWGHERELIRDYERYGI